ncbi:hypothetical protein MRX96_034308 [Rhipicephalus microplus]
MILDLHLQANVSNNISFQRIDQSVVQIGRHLKRVFNKHRGMRESDLVRLFQVFICSRITYSAPYLQVSPALKANGWRQHFAMHIRQAGVFSCPQSLTKYVHLLASPTM